MIFDHEIYDYLEGKKFSNGCDVRWSGENPPGDRISYIANLVKGKNVIHVGCADHIPLIKAKMAENTWLHSQLKTACKKLVGIDINQKAIEYIKRLGIRDVFCMDVIEDRVPLEISQEKWDYVVLGEIVEHVNNPVTFLSVFRNNYAPFVERIIITVPNAFRYANFRQVLKGIEFINTDHRFWFTPYTLAKVFHQSGLSVLNFYFANSYEPSNRLKRMIYDRFPQFKETIIMEARLKP